MTNEFYCKLFDKTINKKRKSKHITTRTHKQNERMIIYKYHIEKPDLNKIVGIINKNVNEFQNDFESGNVSLLFNNDYDIEIMRVGLHYIQILGSYLTFLEMMYIINISRLTKKIKTSLNQMTKSYYLKMKKPRIEWVLLKKNIDHYIYLSSYSCYKICPHYLIPLRYC